MVEVLFGEGALGQGPVKEAAIDGVQAKGGDAGFAVIQHLILRDAEGAAERVTERAVQHAQVLGGLIKHAQLVDRMKGEQLAKPGPRPVTIATVSDPPDLLARKPEPSHGAAKGAVRDHHARVEFELRVLILELCTGRPDHEAHDVPVLRPGEDAPRRRVVPLALVGHHVAGRLEALHDVSHIVARHVETVLSAANQLDALAEGEDAKDDAPRELRGVCSRHAGGLGAARWAAARPGGRAAQEIARFAQIAEIAGLTAQVPAPPGDHHHPCPKVRIPSVDRK